MSVSIEEFKAFQEAIQDRSMRLELRVQENTEITQTVAANTQGVVDAFNAATGAFKVLEFIGKMAKPLIWVLGLGATVAMNAAALKASISSFFSHLVK